MGMVAACQSTEVIKIKNEWCKGCGLCIGFCPKDVLGLNLQGKAIIEKPEKCVQCGLCELYCPDFAITILEAEHETNDSLVAR